MPWMKSDTFLLFKEAEFLISAGAQYVVGRESLIATTWER
jgi:hypothetical protein